METFIPCCARPREQSDTIIYICANSSKPTGVSAA